MKRLIFALAALLTALVLLELPGCAGDCRATIALAIAR
jgi:hypothetical protein